MAKMLMRLCLLFPLLANSYRAQTAEMDGTLAIASDNLEEEHAVVQPVDTRNIRYMRNSDQIFEAAIAKATEMGEGVAMVLADHTGTTLRIETTPGGNGYRNFAAGKIQALIYNDLDNSKLCQRSLCGPGAIASYAFTGRAGIQGAVMFQYYHPEDGQVTGFFSVSGCMDMWDDVLIAKSGLEGASYTLVNGETDVYGFGLVHGANQIANTAGFQGSLVEAATSDNLEEEHAVVQPADTRNIRYMRNTDRIFEAAIATANNMSQGVAMLLADHTGTTLRIETTAGGNGYRSFAAGKVQALIYNDLDNSKLCQRSLCAPGAIASYAFTGRAGVQGAVMFQYYHPEDGQVTGFFVVSGCFDMWDDVLIAKSGLEAAGYTLVGHETDVYGFGLVHDANNVADGFQGSR